MIAAILAFILSGPAQAQWSSQDYTAGKAVSVAIGGVDLSTVTTAIVAASEKNTYASTKTFTTEVLTATMTITTAIICPPMTKAVARGLTTVFGQIMCCSDCARPYSMHVGTTTKNGWREQGLTTGVQ